MTNKELGYLGERITCDFLVKHGYEICCRNFCIRGGEIDIIAKIGEIIAFVEVKTRKDGALQTGFEAVGRKKQRLIINAAAGYYRKMNITLQPRFDIANITIDNNGDISMNYIENAFDATGIDIVF